MSIIDTINAQTPQNRDRVVDFLRAGAILVVCLGHWLMAGVYVNEAGDLKRTGLLSVADFIHPLTWVLQVMPVFFLVGGFVNSRSYINNKASSLTYAAWLKTRLRRLIVPVLFLMGFWALLAPISIIVGFDENLLRIAAAASLVPTWFLAVYMIICALTPLVVKIYDRLKLTSLIVLIFVALGVDYVSISQDLLFIGFVNYLIVWVSAYMLGYAWGCNDLNNIVVKVGLIVVGLTGLFILCVFGPYAVSMVGVSNHGIDNAYPARAPLLFLSIFQTGLVLVCLPSLRKFVLNKFVWAGVVLVNMKIMTIYLWHLTVLGVVVGVLFTFGGFGLHVEVNSSLWWLTRPIWFSILGLVTFVFVKALGRFENVKTSQTTTHLFLVLVALIGICASIAVMADMGIVTNEGTINWWLPLLPIGFAFITGLVSLPQRFTIHENKSKS